MKKYIVLGLCLLLLSVIVQGGTARAADEATPAYPAAQAPANPEAQIQFEPADYTVAAKLTESVKSDSILFDILILRPAGILACGLGLAASVAALPFSLPSGSQKEVTKSLIDEPFAYTFKRPVGEIDP